MKSRMGMLGAIIGLGLLGMNEPLSGGSHLRARVKGNKNGHSSWNNKLTPAQKKKRKKAKNASKARARMYKAA